MKFIIERSNTPIYNRIAIAITENLRAIGHEVYFIETDGFNTANFLNTINNINIDYYIQTNDKNFIYKKQENSERFIFEDIKHKIIVIHHDSSFCEACSIPETEKYLNSLKVNSDRIFHFFIEKSNKIYFEKNGILNCHLINHASEFPFEKIEDQNYRHDLSFVGHLMSSLSAYPIDSIFAGHHLISLVWQRVSKSEFEIQPAIWSLINDNSLMDHLGLTKYNPLAVFQYLLQEVTKLSMAYRGEIISKIKDFEISIYGGDLSYGSINDPLMKIKQSNVQYLPATSDYQDTRSIYKSTKININLTSLQFDSGINNRIVDIVMSGGFVLTDKRSSLLELCPSSQLVSFGSPEEMTHQIEYYLHSSNYEKYLDIKEAIYQEMAEKFSYKTVLSNIINKL